MRQSIQTEKYDSEPITKSRVDVPTIDLKAILLHYFVGSVLMALGGVWPLMLWWTVLFGGPELSSLRDGFFYSITEVAAEPILIGSLLILCLPLIKTKIKLYYILVFATPLVVISLYFMFRIYVF